MSDFAVYRRVHFIYTRLLKRFGAADVRVWVQYIDFCTTTRASRAMAKVLPRALALHPRSVTLWLLAASWEFDSEHNIENARGVHALHTHTHLHCTCTLSHKSRNPLSPSWHSLHAARLAGQWQQ